MSDTSQTRSVGDLAPPGARVASGVGKLVADRYELLEFLGRGGSGLVYRAYDRLLKCEVALKVVHPDRDQARTLSRVRRETTVAREVESPRLARIFEVGQSSDGLYLTMELLPGGSLLDRLSKEPRLPIASALRIAEEVLEGLAVLHQKGVLHRDVTPGNILFDSDGEAKLADYGLARHRDREESLLTEEGAVLGTSGYLSPEQARGEEVSARSDLYSFGVVLFRMLTGRMPTEMSSSLGARLAALVAVPSVRAFRPEVPQWLASVVARLLEPRPEDRYPNAEAVLRDLRTHQPRSRPRVLRRLIQAAAIVLVCLLLVGVIASRRRQISFSHLVPAGETGVKAISETGATLWTLPGVDPEIADRWAFARFTPGERRLLAIVRLKPGRWMPEDVSTLSFLDPTSGEVVKEVKLPSGAKPFTADPPRFNVASIKAVDLFEDGVDVVIVNYCHMPEAPFYAVLYSPRFDSARIVYYSQGSQDFQGATDLDGDGVKELVFAGINNGWNWVNVVAAVRLDPASLNGGERLSPVAAPDMTREAAQDQSLLWYAVIPRGHLRELSRLTIDEKRRELLIHYSSGKTWTLGFDGFPPGSSAVDGLHRQADRKATYAHLREASRLHQAGALDLALVEAEAAIDRASKAGEVWLGQYGERLRGKLLVAAGKKEETESIFLSLAERAEDGPELAYDAAVAYHLQGDLPRAVEWYQRGIGRESAQGAGKSKHEFLAGEVLALVEMEKFADALAATDRFAATYPVLDSQAWLFREFVRWQSGERPRVIAEKLPANSTDLYRYWELEFLFANGADPISTLGRVDRFLAEQPVTRGPLLSLRAEILARLGRRDESAESVKLAVDLVRKYSPSRILDRGHLGLVEGRAQRLLRSLEPRRER